MSAPTVEVQLSVTVEGSELANNSYQVPFTINAGPVEDDYCPLEADTTALAERIESAVSQFENALTK